MYSQSWHSKAVFYDSIQNIFLSYPKLKKNHLDTLKTRWNIIIYYSAPDFKPVSLFLAHRAAAASLSQRGNAYVARLFNFQLRLDQACKYQLKYCFIINYRFSSGFRTQTSCTLSVLFYVASSPTIWNSQKDWNCSDWL